MRSRRFVALGAVAASVMMSCGTGGVTLREDDPAAAAPVSPTPSTSTVPPTTEPSTTSTTTTSTTTTTTSTTIPQVPMRFDDEGVPVNGQTHGVVVTPSGHITPVFGPTDDGGWRIWTPCGLESEIADGEFIETVDFVIDPGHGGSSEPGAVGPNGLREADLNLIVAERVTTGLRAAGFSVIMTRDRDERVPIVTRGEIALALDPLAFISIHHNAGIDAPSSSPGTEMYHQIEEPESRRLAGLMLEEARAALSDYDTNWVSMSDAGAMVRPNREGGDYYGVLRRPAGVTSVLAEFAYLSNGAEAELLARPDVQESLASSVVAAVERFTTSDDPGSGFTDDPIFRGYGPSGAGRTEGCVDPALQ